ncbi:SWIM zinc finger family protein [Runella zeae]|uniref:SWIM zinc finger family protein n=1 Tax=Runella zeae TaxID=94255 RepID=UPI0023562D86|nr:SWIM zinc finger family protein [Runella zeae]
MLFFQFQKPTPTIILNLTEQSVETLAPDAASLKAGKTLSNAAGWVITSYNQRVLWGEIKGSGSKPYRTQIDLQNIAFKCSCPSFKFPCKHGLGLMLAFAKQKEAFTQTDDEPDWVKEWIEKRTQKAEAKSEAPKENTLADEEKAKKSKEKRQNERLSQVEGGVAELRLWLKDLIRTGLIQLPTKERRFFEQTAARMIDAKASGLAGRVRTLRDLDYIQNDDWQRKALEITAELFLLLEAFKNLDSLPPLWQLSVKNLIGWSQSPKELLQNPEAERIKDIWMVLGQHQEEAEGIIIQRNWLLGTATDRTALILNFGTPFSPLENTILPGTIIEAELVFFPAVVPQRATLGVQKGFVSELSFELNFCNGWHEVYTKRSQLLRQFPFINDVSFVIENLRLVVENQQPILCDQEGFFHPIVPAWEETKLLNLMAFSGFQPVTMAGVYRQNGFLPLGIFQHNKYILL